MTHQEPTEKIAAFFERYIFGRDELVLTLKSRSGASINIDGPFHRQSFTWPDKGYAEDVIQPAFASKRAGAGETNVHMHVPWDRCGDGELYVRLWYEGSPYILQTLRICFFLAPPPLPSPEERGDELFWFYAYQAGPHRHPLCDHLPSQGKYSALQRVAEIPL